MSNQISELKSRHAQANKEIKATTANVAKLYEDVRLRLNQKLQSFVLKHKADDYQGKALVACIEGLQKEYAEFEAQFRKEMKRAIPYVAEGYYFDALHDMGEVLGKFDTKRVEAVLQDTYTHIAGMTQYMTGTTVQNLRNVVARTLRESAMSGMTQKEVSATLLERLLAADSQFKFVDAKNRVWNTNAYVEMLSRTTLLNAGRETYLNTCAEKGKDVVRITVSGNACPKCAEWENRLVSISGNTKGLPTLQTAIDSGLFHPNCTHSTVAVGDYDRETNYDENGRPKKGYNSADNPNPKGTDKEANREYRKSLTGKGEKIDKIMDNNQNKTYKSNKADGKFKEITDENLAEFSQQWEKQLKGKITPENKDAFSWYNGIAGSAINQMLRQSGDNLIKQWDKSQFMEIANQLSELFDRVKTTEDLILYRCVESGKFLPKQINSVFIEKGFSSCSIKPQLSFGKTILKIKVPKGTRGAFMHSLSNHPSEIEFLLDKDTKYVILGEDTMKIYENQYKVILIEVKND